MAKCYKSMLAFITLLNQLFYARQMNPAQVCNQCWIQALLGSSKFNIPCTFHEMRKNWWWSFHSLLFINPVPHLDSFCVQRNLLLPNFSAHGFNPAFDPKHLPPKVTAFLIAVSSNPLSHLLSAYLFCLLIPCRWLDKEPKSIAGFIS